jgi:ubiquinone/menaquinone biosynthesis C-methylase UbiE
MVSDPANQAWRVWDRETSYGDLLYQRAVGSQAEMESSKAAAGIIKGMTHAGDTILDVGCGAGHYLRSLRREIDVPFRYLGADATRYYTTLAHQAWHGNGDTGFATADIFRLPFRDSACDTVMCCNLLMHLPAVKQPIHELVRVAAKRVLIRTFVGVRSFRIQEVYGPETHPDSFNGSIDESEFNEDGEPNSFHYYNIYSRAYLEKLLSQIDGIESFKIYPDNSYDSANIASEEREDFTPDQTGMLGGWQINGYVLLPWHFIEIFKRG